MQQSQQQCKLMTQLSSGSMQADDAAVAQWQQQVMTQQWHSGSNAS